MNHMWRLLVGVVFVIVFSFSGLILAPGMQQGWAEPRMIEGEDGEKQPYPLALSEYREAHGFNVYRAEGCLYCHSQQVRPDALGQDLARGYGDRRSVPLDYALDNPPMMGTMRTGPDLSNIGLRQPADAWHHLHLWDARLVSQGSIMPPFKYLYRVVHKDPGARGYALPEGSVPGDSQAWIVPNDDALALVAYLKSRHQDHTLKQVQ